MQGDPGGHEEGHDDPVGGVGGARSMFASVPLTPVKQARVLVGQEELLLKYDILFLVDRGFKYYLINVNHSNMNERLRNFCYFAIIGSSQENFLNFRSSL